MFQALLALSHYRKEEFKLRKIGFVVDSTLGISKEEAQKLGIEVVSLKVLIDENEYVDGEFDYNYVIQGLDQKKVIKTSQPAPEQFINAVKRQLEKGFSDVVILTISQKLSGTINSANIAKNTLDLENVHVIDSKTTISGGTYILKEALELANKGASIKDVLENIHLNVETGSLLFTVDNLSVLVRNGRLSRVQSLIGNVLRIKPILRFQLGELSVEHKSRGFHKVLEYILEDIKKVALDKQVIVKIGFVDQGDKAQELFDLIKQEVPNVKLELTGVISPVVAAHVGLGGLGIYLNVK